MEQLKEPAAARPKILIAEDDPGVRRSLQLLLQGRGFDVRSYASGAALLADRTTRDAVCFVADYAMPDIDGMALLRELRADGWAGPAVLITAYHSANLEERATIEGFAKVFEKPFMDHMLTDAVARLAANPSA
jgi:FixJ family two-component response regulator